MEELGGSVGTQVVPTGQTAQSDTKPKEEEAGKGGKEQDANAPLPEEIAKLSEEDAKKMLWNNQRLQGKQATELGEARKKVEELEGKAKISDSLSSFIFGMPSPEKKEPEKKPPSEKPPVRTGEEFLSEEAIKNEFDKDVIELGVEEATKNMALRLNELSKTELTLTAQRMEGKRESMAILKEFLKDDTNKTIFEGYMTSLSETERNTWQIIIRNNPLFIHQLIASAKGNITPEILEKIKKQGVQQAEQKKTELELGAGSPVGGGEAKPKDALGDSLRGVAKDGLL